MERNKIVEDVGKNRKIEENVLFFYAGDQRQKRFVLHRRGMLFDVGLVFRGVSQLVF